MAGTITKEQAGREAHLQLKTNGQLEVQLYCGALELTLQGIEDCDVNLGPIERTVRGVELHADRLCVVQRARSKILYPIEKHS